MTTELLTFRADTLSIVWRLAANWCRAHGRLPVSVIQERAGAGHRRVRVESIPSHTAEVFAQWSAEDAKARKSNGIPIIAKKVLEARDKAMTEADRKDKATRRDFEIAMRSRYDGQDGPWVEMPWMGDGLLRSLNTAPVRAVVLSEDGKPIPPVRCMDAKTA